jgi:class 3 adenylate cyclase/tetratricopeptide (TPR) repeat protein
LNCPNCQHLNRSEAKFCEECGATLPRVCATCGYELSPAAKFCPECGQAIGLSSSGKIGTSEPQWQFASPEAYTPSHLAEKILTSRAALEGERKQVTALFADLKGSMEMLADRDPEEARKLLDPVLQHMMEAVHHYEGTVSLVMGDGIMALFGAPLAHEDHAVRACYAALRMQDLVRRYAEDARRSHGVNVQIRIGLNSGEVVVRAIGSDLRMDYTAIGRTTHLAARMEQLASPGSILLTPSTLEMVEGFIAVKPLGRVPVKGLAEPVDVYEVTGAGPARTRLQATAGRGLTRFVGRDVELEQLWRARQLATDARGQVVAIVGEAGVGKSRLVYEFAHSHRLQGWLILDGASVSYGKATSYLPVINLLKDYFKIQDRDDSREVREKVTGKLLTLDDALKPTLPALLPLFDISVDDPTWQALTPSQRRRLTFDAVRRLLLREAREQPLLLIFEDLHWIDGETQALLDALVESLGSARLLLLLNYRPEYQHTWGNKTYYSQIRLDALPAESAEELLDALLGADAGLAPLKELLVRRGNPLFLEETIRTLAETKVLAGERGRYRLMQPVQTIHVPPTVQAMLAARIDRLSSEDKRLLQVASVVGKDVPLALLQAIAELSEEALRCGLDHLQAAELLFETGLYPDLEYSFKHDLTHDVTYAGLLQERRRTLHARIVDAIEVIYRERLSGEIERLAHHAIRGELREKAVHYLRQAGLKAAAQSAVQDARAWFEQAVSVLDMLPQDQSTMQQAFEIRAELRPVLNQLGEIRALLERLREAETLAERLNDDRRRGEVRAFMTSTHAQLGELDDALVTCTRALEIAGSPEDLRLRIHLTSSLEQVYYFRGEYGRVIETATGNLAALPPEWSREFFGNSATASVYDRCWLFRSLAQLGRFTEAARYEAETIPLAEPTNHAYTIGLAYYAAGILYLIKGDWTKARSRIERGISVFRTANVALLMPSALAASTLALAELGESVDAARRLGEAEQLLERQAGRGVVLHRSWDYRTLAHACLVLCRPDDARKLADRAVKSAISYHGFMAHAQHLLGDIATHPDLFDAESGEAHYRQALALAEPRGMRPLIAHCYLGLGKLYQRTSKKEAAHEQLTTAITMYREMDMRFWLEQGEAHLVM